MDWLTFFSKLVEALIWPTLILFVAIRFRTEFSNILLNITKFKGPGFELERQLKEADQIADQTNLPEGAAGQRKGIDEASVNRMKVVDDLVLESPGGAVIIMWTVVENELGNAFGTNWKRPHGFGLSFTVPDPLLDLYNRLKTIRDGVAHSLHGVSIDEARQFITLSRRFLAAVEEIKNPVQEVGNEKFATSEELLQLLKEKSAAIRTVRIPRTTHMKFTKQGERPIVMKDVGVVLKMIDGSTRMLHIDDAEKLLNDGILNEMHVPINFMREWE
jgi:hypothetical protein